MRSDQPDLSMRQLAVVLVVYQTEEPQTVRGLAASLNIQKPAVTRALDCLEEIDLARRKVDPRDRRSIIVERTGTGDAMLKRLQDAMAEAEIHCIDVPERQRSIA
ncbi:MarR family transcriptional regulator [Belnapia moabensis]|uniref:MarR family transcriptional regulator n=1 Tax=Belnapia moabensis TaxID=365533 RepID=UPI0038CD1541